MPLLATERDGDILGIYFKGEGETKRGREKKGGKKRQKTEWRCSILEMLSGRGPDQGSLSKRRAGGESRAKLVRTAAAV